MALPSSYSLACMFSMLSLVVRTWNDGVRTDVHSCSGSEQSLDTVPIALRRHKMQRRPLLPRPQGVVMKGEGGLGEGGVGAFRSPYLEGTRTGGDPNSRGTSNRKAASTLPPAWRLAGAISARRRFLKKTKKFERSGQGGTSRMVRHKGNLEALIP